MKAAALSVGLLALAAGSASGQLITDFDSGTGGWSVSGRDDISVVGGNPGANMDVILIDVFGADIRNDSNPDVLGDLRRYGAFELTLDIKVNSITFGFENEVPRDLVIQLRDYDNDNGLPWTSVYYNLGVIEQANGGNEWRTISVGISDPNDPQLPLGWGGTGDENPQTGEPFLPANRTFASVLASVDEIAFTTFKPGYSFGFTNFEIQVDNIGIRPVTVPCLADVNGDGLVTPADFSAWVAAFNTRAQGCDQNGDRECTAADFSAWIANFNAGC